MAANIFGPKQKKQMAKEIWPENITAASSASLRPGASAVKIKIGGIIIFGPIIFLFFYFVAVQKYSAFICRRLFLLPLKHRRSFSFAWLNKNNRSKIKGTVCLCFCCFTFWTDFYYCNSRIFSYPLPNACLSSFSKVLRGCYWRTCR